MKLSYLALVVLFSAPVAACSPEASDVSGETARQESDALTKRPIAFVRQFVGTYYPNDLQADVQALELRATGRYKVTFLDGSIETGSLRGPTKPTTPLKIVFLTSGLMFTGVVANGYGTSPTTLTIKRDGSDTVLVLDRPAVADESLCDDSGGSWTDDEADPSTGLYCVCPSPKSFIPSEGGCVH